MQRGHSLRNTSPEIHFSQIVANAMKEQKPIVSDYPFSDKQKSKLKKLAIQFNYDFLTIRLVGDMDVICQRSRARDLDSSRHLGHLVSRYHKGDTLLNRENADCLVDEATLKKRCSDRGYDQDINILKYLQEWVCYQHR